MMSRIALIILATTVPLTYAAQVILPGQILSGEISSSSEQHEYTFTAEAGEMVRLMMRAEGAGMEPAIELYGPDGSRVDHGEAFLSRAVNLHVEQLATSGAYQVLCSGKGGTAIGAYSVSLIKYPGANLSEGDEGGVIQPGEIRTGSAAFADLDWYVFTAEAGDMVRLMMRADGVDMDPAIELYGPDGSRVDHGEAFLSRAVNLHVEQLAASGTYLVLCSGKQGAAIGAYSVTLIKYPGANLSEGDEGGVIQPGEIRTGSAAFADLDWYVFTAEAGDMVRLMMRADGVDMDPAIELYGPDGSRVDHGEAFLSRAVNLHVEQLVLLRQECVRGFWGPG